MMKLLLIILMSALVQQSLQQSLKELKEIAQASVVDCYEDEENTKKIEITDAGFEGIGNCSSDVDRNSKCIIYCILKKYNWFWSDYSLNESEVVPVLKHLSNDAIDRNQLKNITDSCNIEISRETDRCERSHMANRCLLKRLKDSGVQNI